MKDILNMGLASQFSKEGQQNLSYRSGNPSRNGHGVEEMKMNSVKSTNIYEQQ